MERNKKFECPEDILKKQDPELLNKWLLQSVAEICQSNRNEYPPRSIYQILCGVYQYMCSLNNSCPNFLDKKRSSFYKHSQGL